MDRTVSTAPAHRLVHSRLIVDLDAMSDNERRAFGAQLFRLHCLVFAGVSEQAFLDHVILPPADRNLVQLYLGEDGELAGYCAVHRFARRIRGRACTVIRAEAGLRPEFRGRGTTFWFGMTYALRCKLRDPLTPIYYLGTLVHTSSYHLFCKYFPRVYPSPGRPMPPAMRALALDLVESFDAPAVDPADPLVRDVGWITQESRHEADLNLRGDLPDVRYYQQRNPGYRLGHGLVVLVPLGLVDVLGAMAARLWETMRDALHRRAPRL